MRKTTPLARKMLLCTLALVVTNGCNSSSDKTPSATAPATGRDAAVRPLASITDQQEFSSQLRLFANPHLMESAKYFSATSGGATANNALPPGAGNDIQIQVYPLMAAIWKSPVVQICWENPSQSFTAQMSQVQQAIAGTWQAASKLQFTGWQTCAATSPATQQIVRIQIDDSSPNNGPRTLGLGNQLAGVQHGMLLNFTFLHWGTNCQTMTDYCIKAISVHEFGHAIGFAHEQNRPDTPGECMQLAQGSNGDDVLLTPYDPDSVMNYCNKKYNNNGQLSALDKKGVQDLYGAPQ